MNRKMYDATGGDALSLPRDGQIYAGYDTGSPGIPWNAAERASIPPGAQLLMIDQGFTGSPNPAANIRDCEKGAWSLERAVDRSGWQTARPTLYLGWPDTVANAWSAGWRGDVWIAAPSSAPPSAPPQAPVGINIVAAQWHYTGLWDESVVFDNTWWPTGGGPNWTERLMQELSTIGQGATGADVSSAQGLLIARGHPVVVDGKFGPVTASNVAAFQSSRGLAADGIVGPQTWPALLNRLALPPLAEPVYVRYPRGIELGEWEP